MGVMGLYAITGAGLLKSIYVDENTRLDITPQDVGVKNMLYFALKASQIYEKTKPNEAPVYITSNGTYFNLKLKDYINLMRDFNLWEKSAYEKNLLVPGLYCTSNRFVYMFMVRKSLSFGSPYQINFNFSKIFLGPLHAYFASLICGLDIAA